MAKKSKQEKAQERKARYGFVALLGKEIPEIGKLLKKAVDQKWTSDRFAMAIANTSWWKHTPQNKRQWITQRITDPASAKQEMNVGAGQIMQRAVSLGIGMPKHQRAERLWLHARLRGLEGSQLDAYIFREVSRGNAVQRIRNSSGQYGTMLRDMKDIAYQYGYLRDSKWEDNPRILNEIVNRANRIMGTGGEGDPLPEWERKMRGFAASRYTAFADRIQAGETVLEIAEPFVQTISETLELNPDDIELNDKLLQRAMLGRKNKEGKPEAMNLEEVAEAARRDHRWRKTNNAMQAAAETATQIGQMWGMIP